MASEEFLFGRCQLRLRDIEIDPDYCRDRIDAAVQRLQPVFEDPNKFKPHIPNHQLPILVNLEGFKQLLEDSKVSQDEFRESQLGPQYSQLTSLNGKLRCIHGRQRYEAAISSKELGQDTWWTVKLYCLPEGIDPRILLCEEVEHDHYQTEYNDGHIFCAVLYWEKQGDKNRVSDWMMKLSPAKQKGLNVMTRCKPIKYRLSRLRAFPGLLDALELGNGDRVVRRLSLPETIRYLDHIYTVWDKITLGRPRIQRAVDALTVRRLQMLGPSASSRDRGVIQDLMKSRGIFSKLKDARSRTEIEQCILRLDVLIPSMKSFHENSKYLHIANSIMKCHLIPTLRKGQSISEELSDLWEEPDHCLIEYAEGKFLRAARRPSRNLSHLMIVIAALRNFPRLCDDDYMGPRCEPGASHIRPSVDPIVVNNFRALAQKVGYSIAIVPLPLSEVSDIRRSVIEPREVSVERRWNRPFSDSAQFSASELFLPRLAEHQIMGTHPGTLFIQRDFIQSFFSAIPDCERLALIRTVSPEPHTQFIHQSDNDMSNSPQTEHTPRSHTPSDIASQSQLPSPAAGGLGSVSGTASHLPQPSPSSDDQRNSYANDPRRFGWFPTSFQWSTDCETLDQLSELSGSPSIGGTWPSSPRSVSFSSANSSRLQLNSSAGSTGISMRSVGGLTVSSRASHAKRSTRSTRSGMSTRSAGRSAVSSRMLNAARSASYSTRSVAGPSVSSRIMNTDSTDLSLRSIGRSSQTSNLGGIDHRLSNSPRSVALSSAGTVSSSMNSRLSNLGI